MQRTAPKKTWIKHIDEDLKPQRISTGEARDIATDRRRWKQIVNDSSQPAVPTAAYWLRGRPAYQAPATE
ncbi:unnamed protein product [Didymodactylos carnosus]|uniref:Uncharacterized protein n=1 Tax=Didymodactylos carnosus TaxID=1234261 RepID=A0A8S2QW44_9BILA|nr:unnamed protein product [Didymodactylos carnosus]CAF4117018.1 unnamed protein product [Didymodactylos carnosus]